jgi:hypothetical protein
MIDLDDQQEQRTLQYNKFFKKNNDMHEEVNRHTRTTYNTFKHILYTQRLQRQKGEKAKTKIHSSFHIDNLVRGNQQYILFKSK